MSGMKTLVSGMLYLVLGVGSISAQGSSPSIEAAAARLAKVPVFAIGGIGFAGVTSEGERDFRTIMANHTAPDVFATLYERGNNQAKAYALLGLYRLKPDRFREIYASLSESNTELFMMRGCIGSKEKLRAIAKRINDGEFLK